MAAKQLHFLQNGWYRYPTKSTEPCLRKGAHHPPEVTQLLSLPMEC